MTNIIITKAVCPETGGRIAIDPEMGVGYAYPLTVCCSASATGTEDGVCCRKCYRRVNDYFGGGVYMDNLRSWWGKEVAAELIAALAEYRRTKEDA